MWNSFSDKYIMYAHKHKHTLSFNVSCGQVQAYFEFLNTFFVRATFMQQNNPTLYV